MYGKVIFVSLNPNYKIMGINERTVVGSFEVPRIPHYSTDSAAAWAAIRVIFFIREDAKITSRDCFVVLSTLIAASAQYYRRTIIVTESVFSTSLNQYFQGYFFFKVSHTEIAYRFLTLWLYRPRHLLATPIEGIAEYAVVFSQQGLGVGVVVLLEPGVMSDV